MNFNIIPTPSFEKELKRLAKKHPSVKKVIKELAEKLIENPTIGTRWEMIVTK